MKTTVRVLLFAAFILIFYQCEKSIPESEFDVTNQTIPFKASSQDIESLILNGYDSDIVLLNQNSYLLAKALLVMYADKDYNSLIKEIHSKYKLECIPFSLLFENSEFESTMNMTIDASLSNSLLKNTTGVSCAQQLYSTYTVHSNQQEPIINLINPDVADFSLPPIISPALEVEDDPDQGINDCIVAWFEDELGSIHEIIISEQEALNSKWPVYVLSTIDKKDESKIVAGLYKNEHLISNTSISAKKSTAAIDYFDTYEYQINYRYESTGNSEFCIVTYRVEDTGTGWDTHWIYNDNNDDSKKIADVDADDIGDELHKWEFFIDSYTPYDDNYIFFNTFERDWYSGPKNLGEIDYPSGGLTLYIYGRMGSSTNWYTNDPSSYDWNDDVDEDYINTNWAQWYENYKGKIRIWRID